MSEPDTTTDETRTANHAEQFDYPVELGEHHRAVESCDYPDDRFECHTRAYMHTGAWPTWDFCPFCGGVLPDQ